MFTLERRDGEAGWKIQTTIPFEPRAALDIAVVPWWKIMHRLSFYPAEMSSYGSVALQKMAQGIFYRLLLAWSKH